MERKYTKGPWVVYKSGTEGASFGIDGGDGSAVVYFGTDAYEGIENFSNAQLIAAAPDLLKALVYARRFMKADMFDLEYIDAAIARATGASKLSTPPKTQKTPSSVMLAPLVLMSAVSSHTTTAFIEVTPGFC